MPDALPSIPLADLQPLTWGERFFKRALDLSVASVGLLLLGWLIAAIYAVARITSGQSGFFLQDRVGKNGQLFRTWKFRTMRALEGYESSVTTVDDPRITTLGRFLRNTKLDELPQLINILLGDMSLVGPRPDVPGFADQLAGADRIILAVRPGITGPATLVFRHEEQLLAEQADFEEYNREVIYPEKVRINREYLENYSISRDLKCLWDTALTMVPLGGPEIVLAQDLALGLGRAEANNPVQRAA
jgi:lipopolysaccharide/colanic/teichoic acid biosynthesis glycosyltransferase